MATRKSSIPQLTHLDAAGRPAMVDVSAKAVSARSAVAECRVKFPAAVAAQLRASGLRAGKGGIVETAVIAGTMAAKRTHELIPFCHALPLDGVRIAIDDFGTGYSSLSYLDALPLDIIKIDRSFVRHIPFNEQDRLLLDGIINIVHNLGMQVVIEGVETREQLNFLCQKGCAFTQGYLLSRPLPFDDLTEYLSLNRQGMNLANLTTVS